MIKAESDGFPSERTWVEGAVTEVKDLIASAKKAGKVIHVGRLIRPNQKRAVLSNHTFHAVNGNGVGVGHVNDQFADRPFARPGFGVHHIIGEIGNGIAQCLATGFKLIDFFSDCLHNGT